MNAIHSNTFYAIVLIYCLNLKFCNLDKYYDLLFIFLIMLQECESALKHKSELIGRLETKTTAMTDTLQKLDNK